MTTVELESWINFIKGSSDIRIVNMDLAQKAKVSWRFKGDEDFTYFLYIVN